MQEKFRIGGAYCPSHGPQASGREWRLRFYKRHGFLKQTCPAHLLSAVRHILGTSAAERLAATRPTHCCLKINLNNCSRVFSSHMAQLTAQSLCCNKFRPSASLHMTGSFCSCKEGMGMMPPFNAEMVERTRLSGTSSFWYGLDA